ncbi:putative phosphoglycerate mutase pmu1 [Microbotryomycetes sp. JL201]|nr:putative phosphoglycerate mutase pmu1 [Microbotryomycetes sp. JL201]
MHVDDRQWPFLSTSRPKPGCKTFVPTNFTSVSGLFGPTTEYSAELSPLELLDRSPERWRKFARHVERLNDEADDHTTYKVLYVARHGQGYHNVAEIKYGTPAWNAYWSRLETDGDIRWGPDPELTPLGIEQAKANNQAWKQRIQQGAPLPERIYSSPLSRSARTLELTWHDILIDKRGVKPLVKERLRETIGLHTCDKRREKSVIRRRFPLFEFEPTFSEHDQLWSPDFQESSQQQALRTQQVLNEIFATDSSTYVSITAHGGTIKSLLRVIGHGDVAVPPGGWLPLVIKAVSYRNETNELLAGGQSRHPGPMPTAPPHSEL